MILRLGLLLACLWGGTSHAQSPTQILSAGKCFSAERSVVLYDADGALARGVLSDQQTFDLDRARTRPLARVGARPSTPFCVDGSFDAAGLNIGDLSNAWFKWPVVVVVTPGDVTPIRVFSHIPELANWAGDPFVEIGVIGWEDTADGQETDNTGADMLDLMAAAESMAMSIAAFARGDLEAAISARPAPDGLSPLARAWLSGIPVSYDDGSFFGRGSAVYDAPPSRGGKDTFDLMRGITTGAISPASAIELSTPARDVVCDWGATTDKSEVRWAGFVAGFWHLVQTGNMSLDPDARLDRLGDELSGSRTCFANAMVRLLDPQEQAISSEEIRERLHSIVASTFANSSANADARRQLAAEMLAGVVGYSVLSFEEDNRSDYLAEISAATWLGRCSGPRLSRADRLSTLPMAVEHAPDSPMALLLSIADVVRTEQANLFDEILLAETGPNAWLKAVPETGDVLLTSLRPVDAELAATFERWLRPEVETSIDAALDILVFADEEEFADARPVLLENFYGFDKQSDLARGFLGRTIEVTYDSLFDGGHGIAFLQTHYQEGYQRLLELAPWMTSSEQLDLFFNGSYDGAVKVAEIDLLNLLYSFKVEDILSMSGHRAADAPALPTSILLPPSHRNPWLRFAPRMDSLPELPIPAVGETPNVSAWSVAVSAAVHEAVALAKGETSDDGVDAGHYAALLSVMIDAAYRSLSDRYSADRSYLPNKSTLQMYAAMRAGIIGLEIQNSGLPELYPDIDEVSLTDLIAVGRFGWENGIGAYLVSEWSEDVSARTVTERVEDIELAARVLLAFLLPADINAKDVADDVNARLLEGPEWPLSAQKIMARLSIHLLSSDVIDQDVNTMALFAEFDVVLPVDARQKLIDAGFLQAAVVGVPLRLALASHEAGGVENLTAEHLLAVLQVELARFDYDRAFQESPWRDLGSAFAAFAYALTNTDRPISEDSFLATKLLSPDFRSLLDYGVEIYPSLSLSTEAQTLADMMVLESQGQATEELHVSQLMDQCPELAPTLLPWQAFLHDDAVAADTVEVGLELLRQILASGDQFRTIYALTEVRIASIDIYFVFWQGVPAFASDQPTGGVKLGGTASQDLDSPWQLRSQIGVASTLYEGSPAFAAALELAERAAVNEAPNAAAVLAPLLVALEAIAFGGSLDPNAALPSIAPHRSETRLGDLLGHPLPPTNSALQRVGDLPGAEQRILKLANRAEDLGLDALARRVAGIAMSIALERLDTLEVIDDTSVLLTGNPPPQPTNAQNLRDLIAGERQIGGVSIAQIVASGLVSLPEIWVSDALCADSDEKDCQPTPRFARPVSPEDIADDPMLPACERLARAVMDGGIDLSDLPMSPNCAYGPLGMDIIAASFATIPQPEKFQQFAKMGFTNMQAFGDDVLLRQATVAASEGSFSRQAAIFDDAARLAFYLNDPELVIDLATLRLIAEIADPANTTLAAETKSDILETLAILSDFIDPAQAAFVREIVDSVAIIDQAQRREAQNFLKRRLQTQSR